jgi:YD repeat-containing protein
MGVNPGGGTEYAGYTTNVTGLNLALTSYANQVGNPVLAAYDAAGRLTNVAYPTIATNQFTYGPAGDLLTLVDGKSQTTTWHYDQYGRVTNKVDAAANVLLVYQCDLDNRLTNRWSAAKTNTTYRYDPVGNLTNVVYPVSTNLVLAYDPLNRLTNMVDAVGTTVYSYV